VLLHFNIDFYEKKYYNLLIHADVNLKETEDMNMKKRVVVALGHRALGTTLPEQKIAVKNTAKSIADLIEEGYQVAITHSNAPQVGMIHTAMNEFGKAHDNYTSAPMSVCSAMSQGYIGYDLQNGIREELLNRGIYRTVSTVLTQVIVDPYDEAFYTPTKVLGRYMNAEEANEERKKGNYVVEEPGKGFRRVVSAPNPVKIVEIDAIKVLLDADQVVIACGGGGIPVLEQDNHLKGASAVIEKDLAAGKLAEGINADNLVILTSVEQVCINMGKTNEEKLSEISVDEAKEYMKDGQFGVYNMLPKLRAAVDFIEDREYRTALITSFDKLKDGLKGKAGTTVKQ
jgi:carbamate kinase